ncbi:MAG: type 4a pilus biogenesis protein PilO [Candidatus Omnitrophica bacterium]|nr:type 4a pilus biogenesis protein PilO [Candidatus Omnitrophota bacterium]MDD5592867.1 type 4a pilus biogenesis protein PilO [Candidatus Omnitrophota bacterium]
MKIEYPKGELISLFKQYKGKIPAIVIIIFTLFAAAGIYKSQANILRSMNLRKDRELNKNRVLGEISQSEKKIESYQGMLMEKNAPAIIDKITKLAKDSNIKIISIEPGPQEKHPLYTRYPFILAINAGSYHAVGKFISKIENYSDLYFVNAATIKPAEGSGASGQKSDKGGPATDKLRVNLTLSIIAFTGEK